MMTTPIKVILEEEGTKFTLAGELGEVDFFSNMQAEYENTDVLAATIRGAPAFYNEDMNAVIFDTESLGKYNSMTERSFRAVLLKMKLMSLYSDNPYQALNKQEGWKGNLRAVDAVYVKLAENLKAEFSEIKLKAEYPESIHIYFYWPNNIPYATDGTLSQYLDYAGALRRDETTLHIHELKLDKIQGNENKFFRALLRQSIAATKNLKFGEVTIEQMQNFVDLFLLLPNDLFVHGFPKKASRFLLEQQKACRSQSNFMRDFQPQFELTSTTTFNAERLPCYARLSNRELDKISHLNDDIAQYQSSHPAEVFRQLPGILLLLHFILRCYMHFARAEREDPRRNGPGGPR